MCFGKDESGKSTCCDRYVEGPVVVVLVVFVGVASCWRFFLLL